MPLTTVTLSSVGATNFISVNWVGGKPMSVVVIPGSTGQTSDFTIQYTLDDISRIASTSLVWSGVYLSTAPGAFGPATHFTSSQSQPDGVFYSFLSPVAGLRLSSTAISSSALTMKICQGEGW